MFSASLNKSFKKFILCIVLLLLFLVSVVYYYYYYLLDVCVCVCDRENFIYGYMGFYMHHPTGRYHGICYTSCEALAGIGNSIMGPPCGINTMTYRTMSKQATSEMRSAP